MGTISFGGLGNGIDFSQVVDQLVRVARQPVDRLTEKKTSLNSKLGDYSTLGAKLIALQSAADKLRLSTAYDRAATSVSNTDVMTASGSSTATPGTYKVKITTLAQAHQVASKEAVAVGATTTDIVPGTSGTFTFHVGSGASQTVTLSATATLDDLKTAINDLGAGVTASVLNAGSETAPGYRLVLTSTNSGESNVITIEADTTSLNMTPTGSGVDTLQAAKDAEISVGSATTVTLKRSSNTISDAIPGVTLTLMDATGTPTVQVNVTRDVGAVKDNIKALASAYNDVVKFINERNTYDIATKKGGIFFNEPTARGVLTQIRMALSSSVAGLSSIKAVGEIGFKTERDGTITVDDAALDSALASKYSAVKDVFVKQTATVGIAQLMTNAVDALDDASGGALTLRKNGLTKQISSLTQEIGRKEDMLALYEDRLKRQYAALDGLLGRMQSQSGYLQATSSALKHN